MLVRPWLAFGQWVKTIVSLVNCKSVFGYTEEYFHGNLNNCSPDLCRYCSDIHVVKTGYYIPRVDCWQKPAHRIMTRAGISTSTRGGFQSPGYLRAHYYSATT